MGANDLGWLIDRTRIVETCDRLFIATDRKDWEGVAALFTDSVRFDMTSLAGGAPADLSPATIAGAWREGLGPVAAVHHQTGNYLVTVDGDTAEVFCYGTATHYRPENEKKVTAFVGSYDFTLRRDGDGWRISALRFTKKYVE